MSESTSRPVHYVVLHKPGPKQRYGVGEHVRHYLKLHEQGKLELGGPLLIGDAGGMIIPTKDVSLEEYQTFAAADPAVQSGLLIYEVRPWLTAMEHK